MRKHGKQRTIHHADGTRSYAQWPRRRRWPWVVALIALALLFAALARANSVVGSAPQPSSGTPGSFQFPYYSFCMKADGSGVESCAGGASSGLTPISFSSGTPTTPLYVVFVASQSVNAAQLGEWFVHIVSTFSQANPGYVKSDSTFTVAGANGADLAKETGGNLASLVAKDFAKESGGNLASLVAKDFATSAAQSTGNSSLSSIDGKLVTGGYGIKVDNSGVVAPISFSLSSGAAANLAALGSVPVSSNTFGVPALVVQDQDTNALLQLVILQLQSIGTRLLLMHSLMGPVQQ